MCFFTARAVGAITCFLTAVAAFVTCFTVGATTHFFTVAKARFPHPHCCCEVEEVRNEVRDDSNPAMFLLLLVCL